MSTSSWQLIKELLGHPALFVGSPPHHIPHLHITYPHLPTSTSHTPTSTSHTPTSTSFVCGRHCFFAHIVQRRHYSFEHIPHASLPLQGRPTNSPLKMTALSLTSQLLSVKSSTLHISLEWTSWPSDSKAAIYIPSGATAIKNTPHCSPAEVLLVLFLYPHWRCLLLKYELAHGHTHMAIHKVCTLTSSTHCVFIS